MRELRQWNLPLVAAGFAGMAMHRLAQALARMREQVWHSPEPDFAARHSLGPPWCQCRCCPPRIRRNNWGSHTPAPSLTKRQEQPQPHCRAAGLQQVRTANHTMQCRPLRAGPLSVRRYRRTAADSPRDYRPTRLFGKTNERQKPVAASFFYTSCSTHATRPSMRLASRLAASWVSGKLAASERST